MSSHIRVAYAISRKGGTQYRARAYITDPSGIKHSRTVAIEGTANEAMRVAIELCQTLCRKDWVPPPTEVIYVGRVRLDSLEWYAF